MAKRSCLGNEKLHFGKKLNCFATKDRGLKSRAWLIFIIFYIIKIIMNNKDLANLCIKNL